MAYSGGLSYGVSLAVVLVGFGPREAVDAGWLTGGRIIAGDAGESQHVIEGTVLQHQNEDVLDRCRAHGLCFYILSIAGARTQIDRVEESGGDPQQRPAQHQ